MKIPKNHNLKTNNSSSFNKFKNTDKNNNISDKVTLSKNTNNKDPWTILVYSSGTRDIDKNIIKSVKSIEKVGSDKNVNVALQLSRVPDSEDNPLKDVKRYYISGKNISTEAKSNSSIESPVVENLGRIDMSNSKNLENFIKWGMEKYPSKHTILVLGGHSSGFMGAISNENRTQLIHLPDIKKAIKNAEISTGEKPDILVFNSCLMSQGEMASELQSTSDYIVAAETIEKGEGMPLGKFIESLKEEVKEDKSFCPEKASNLLLKECNKTPNETPVVSLIDSSKIPTLLNSIDLLGKSLINTNTPKNTIKEIICKTKRVYKEKEIDPPLSDYRDLYDFAKRLTQSSKISDSNIKKSANLLMKNIENTAEISNEDLNLKNSYHGISIYLPTKSPKEFGEYVSNIILGRYGELNFSKKNSWATFLKSIFKK